MKNSNSTYLNIRNSTAEFLMFTADSKGEGIEVRYQDETVWLSQKMIANLFGVDIRTINEHLQNIFKNKELIEDSVIRKFRITATDGKSYQANHYNLDAIISVGYRVNSIKATEFRKWATNILKTFAIQGYVLDRKRLENGKYLSEDYFEKLLQEVREIRLSERKLYQKITDVYATSLDYDKNSKTTKDFFATVQNKLHFAITGKTAAELIKSRANSKEKSMGLVTWEGAPNGKILPIDVTTGKNYLRKNELISLSRIVSAFLDLAEDRAERKIPMTMEDWSKWLDSFLKVDDRLILEGKGSISMEEAKKYALGEFEKFRIVQDKNFESDFDIEVKKLLNSK